MNTQTEALRIADWLEETLPNVELSPIEAQAAAELRRLVSFNQQLMDEVARLQKREWVGLTNDEIAAIYLANTDKPLKPDWLFARAIEVKLKEKNT